MRQPWRLWVFIVGVLLIGIAVNIAICIILIPDRPEGDYIDYSLYTTISMLLWIVTGQAVLTLLGIGLIVVAINNRKESQ